MAGGLDEWRVCLLAPGYPPDGRGLPPARGERASREVRVRAAPLPEAADDRGRPDLHSESGLWDLPAPCSRSARFFEVQDDARDLGAALVSALVQPARLQTLALHRHHVDIELEDAKNPGN